jgi:hypothetical protein
MRGATKERRFPHSQFGRRLRIRRRRAVKPHASRKAARVLARSVAVMETPRTGELQGCAQQGIGEALDVVAL